LLSGGILPWLQGIVATIALVFFVIGAVMYMTGGVDEGNVKQGKATMTAALAGFALALAAPTFLKEIYGIFGASSSTAGPTLIGISLNVLKFLISIVGILGTIMLVVSGLSYMGSAGADDKAKSAKKMATYAVIGIALALAALIIIRQVTKFFS
jgi:membrane protease YdiL (CAAX protease family)